MAKKIAFFENPHKHFTTDTFTAFPVKISLLQSHKKEIKIQNPNYALVFGQSGYQELKVVYRSLALKSQIT